MPLTIAKVQKLTKPGLHNDGGGLYLRVTKSGSRSWIYRYREGERLRDMGLGSFPMVTLADAREKALAARRMRHDGKDPITTIGKRARLTAAKVEKAKAMTFRDAAEAYVAAHSPSWKNPKHAAQWPSTLNTYVYPVFGDLPVQEIDTGLVTRAIEPIWHAKTETASRVRGRIETVLDWATARGYRTGDNPARWKGHLDHLLPAPSKAKQAKRRETGRGEHHAALPYAELPTFLAQLQRQSGLSARILEFAILTAARSGEVRGARWSEIDLEARLWIIPANRMKAGKEHRVPLSEPAIAVLRAMADVRQDRLVFALPGAERPLSDMAMAMLLRRLTSKASLRGRGDLTVHGFRSTFRLVHGADNVPERGPGDGPGPYGWQQGRGSLPAHRPA